MPVDKVFVRIEPDNEETMVPMVLKQKLDRRRALYEASVVRHYVGVGSGVKPPACEPLSSHSTATRRLTCSKSWPAACSTGCMLAASARASQAALCTCEWADSASARPQQMSECP
jgi:hypothetical protein